jgi:hypothetical protein
MDCRNVGQKRDIFTFLLEFLFPGRNGRIAGLEASNTMQHQKNQFPNWLKCSCIPVGIPRSGAGQTDCGIRGEERHGNQKNSFPNTTSRMDVRKARMSLFGEKKKKRKFGEGTSLRFPERFELRGESHPCSGK